jgi:SAM-dependent methyltransferase
MCNNAILNWFEQNVSREEIENRRILEMGSRNVNGTVRPIVMKFKPKEYIGIDIVPGSCVDIVLPAEKSVEYFGKESFDVVISTEMLEHVSDWREVVWNMKEVLKKEGTLFITTRSYGFGLHDYPADYWRFEVEDFENIFKDFRIVKLEKDPEAPGVFFKGIKPLDWKPIDVFSLPIFIYSTKEGKRI